MRTKLLLFVFFIGTTTGILVTLLFVGQKAMANNPHPIPQKPTNTVVEWPDSLDAVVAAPENPRYPRLSRRIQKITLLYYS